MQTLKIPKLKRRATLSHSAYKNYVSRTYILAVSAETHTRTYTFQFTLAPDSAATMSAANQAANNRTERLVDAIRQENTVAAEVLLAADDVTTWINSRLVSPHDNRQFETCLHFACLNGNVKIMRLLLAKGADVTALDFESCTPLHRACASHVDADAKVECLLRRGAASQVNARDDRAQRNGPAACGPASSSAGKFVRRRR